jgi:hypothetical protein
LATCTLLGAVAQPASAVAAGSSAFHGYSIAYQTSGTYTGVRGRWQDFQPGLTKPLLDLAACAGVSDVNAALWMILTDGTQLELGYAVEACGLAGQLEAYRYVAITSPAHDQALTVLDQNGQALDDWTIRFRARDRAHNYAITRGRDPHVWSFTLDDRVVYRWRSVAVLTARTLEVGIESYQPTARIRTTFSALSERKKAAWEPWRRDEVLRTKRMSGSWTGRTAWTSIENG